MSFRIFSEKRLLYYLFYSFTVKGGNPLIIPIKMVYHPLTVDISNYYYHYGVITTMVKLDKIGFLATLVGGIVGLVFGILDLFGITVLSSLYLGGTGFLSLFIVGIIGPIIALVAAGLAVLIGLKTFLEFFDFDKIIWAIIIIILGVAMFGIGGYIVILGGILVLIARFVE